MKTAVQRKSSQSTESSSRTRSSHSTRIQRAPQAGGASGSGLDRAGSALFRAAGMQAKAVVGQPGDKYEKEADVTGERISQGEKAPDIRRMPDKALGGGAQLKADDHNSPLQRLQLQPEEEEPVQALQCQAEEEEEPVQALQRQAEEEQPVQTRSLEAPRPTSAPPTPAPDPAARRSQSPVQQAAERAVADASPGEPLQDETRGRLEQGLGTDLGEVRVHQDAGARTMASNLKAKAFTKGKDIYLGPGQSQSDVALMGHETAHVLQQDAIVRKPPDGAVADAGPAQQDQQVEDTQDAETQTELTDVDREIEAVADVPGAADGADEASAAEAGPDAEQEAQGATEGGEAKDAKKEKSGDAKGKKAGGKPGKNAAAGKDGTTGGSDAKGKQKLKQVLAKVKKEATKQKGAAASKSTQSAASKGAGSSASAAAQVPAKEADSEGKTSKVQDMDAQEKGEVKQTSFMELVEQKLAKMDTPSTPEAMAKFKKKGGAGQLRGQVVGGVKEQAGGAQDAIRGASTAPVNAPPQREAKELPEQPATPEPGNAKAKDVVVPPKSDQEVSLQANQDEVEGKLAENKLSKERLAKANDPRFSAVQSSREEVASDVKAGPEKFRSQEQGVRGRERSLANVDQSKGLGGMQSANMDARKQVTGDQHKGMDKEAAKRQEAVTQIQGMYKVVDKKVNDKLTWLDGEVDRLFDEGEKKARADFENFVDDELSSWKLRRYGSRAMIPIIGAVIAAGTWVYDKARGIDHFPEVQKIFSDGRERYLSGLRSTIKGIATVVETSLTWCKTEIAAGRKEIDAFVKTRDESLQKALTETVDDVFGKFDNLSADVDAKKEDLADKLVQRYKDSRTAIDARIKEMREANKGLVHAFIGKLKAVLEAINNFRKRLVPILRKAGDIVEDILDDPIGFLGNLLSAVKQGFKRFVANIATHLKAGLMGWLFGTMAQMGVEPPKEFSLKAIIGFIMQVLGITWERLRPKIARLIGEKNVALIEKVAGYVQKLFSRGPGGLWEEIKEYVGGIKDMVIGAIKEFVITKIITAAITKLVSMFNPVGAIVQAVLTIYNVIMFFIERIQQILALVGSVVTSAAKVVKGQIGEAAALIEKSMALTVPIIISFLARLLGVGGIAGKIQSIIKKVQKKISKAIDKALKKIVKKLGGIFKKGKGGKGKGATTPGANHKKLARNAKKKLLKPVQAKDLADMINKKRKQADKLEKAAKPKLEKKVRMTITMDQLKDAEKDRKIDYRIRIGPNTHEETFNANADGDSTKIPKVVEAVDTAGQTQIGNFDHQKQSGQIKSSLIAGGAITLHGIKFKPKGESKEKTLPVDDHKVDYTIAPAHGAGFSFAAPAFQLTNKSDPDAVEGYKKMREEFPTVMRQWYEDNPAPLMRFDALSDAAMVKKGTNSFMRGAHKWRFVYGVILEFYRNQLPEERQAEIDGLKSNQKGRKDSIKPILLTLPARTQEEIGKKWMDRWGSSTHLHHMHPLNYGGHNAGSNFVPLKAQKHVGGGGVHPSFWVPLKGFIKSAKAKTSAATSSGAAGGGSS